jgi:murein DD-endopeptidase MepM/ murein hydrolase activator NlpD
MMMGSITVKEGDRVDRGQVIGRIGDSGIAMFPHVHYQLDRGDSANHKPAQARFACYFARARNSQHWRLVISGIPDEGESLLSVDDYLKMIYGQ